MEEIDLSSVVTLPGFKEGVWLRAGLGFGGLLAREIGALVREEWDGVPLEAEEAEVSVSSFSFLRANNLT